MGIAIESRYLDATRSQPPGQDRRRGAATARILSLPTDRSAGLEWEGEPVTLSAPAATASRFAAVRLSENPAIMRPTGMTVVAPTGFEPVFQP